MYPVAEKSVATKWSDVKNNTVFSAHTRDFCEMKMCGHQGLPREGGGQRTCDEPPTSTELA